MLLTALWMFTVKDDAEVLILGIVQLLPVIKQPSFCLSFFEIADLSFYCVSFYKLPLVFFWITEITIIPLCCVNNLKNWFT